MNRNKFLKTLAKSVAVITVVPLVMVQATENRKNPTHDLIKQYPLTIDEAFCGSCDITDGNMVYAYSAKKDPDGYVHEFKRDYELEKLENSNNK